MSNYNAFERICTEAVGCERCFPKMGVARASVDLAQPRYVGPNYWTATERRLFLMINPGAGNGSSSDQAMRRKIISYRNQELSLEQLFEHQRGCIPEWGLGKFLNFVEKMGGSLDDVALLNVAWCATQGDKYPSNMLHTCFTAHTRRALEALQPTVIIACGSLAQKFARSAGLRFVAAPHYAARFAVDFSGVREKILKFAQSIEWTDVAETIVSAIDEALNDNRNRASGRTSRFSGRDVIRLVRRSNPKNGKSARRYECYRDGMTVADYRSEVNRRCGLSETQKCAADLRWDVDRGFIRIEPR